MRSHLQPHRPPCCSSLPCGPAPRPCRLAAPARPGLRPAGLAGGSRLRQAVTARCCGAGSAAAAAAATTAASAGRGLVVTCSASAAAAAAVGPAAAAAAAAAGLSQPAAAVPTAAASASGGAAAAATVVAAQRALPFAALSRVLLSGNNSSVFRTALSQRRQPVSGPMGLLLFLFTLIAASFAAIRGALVKRGKSCRTCRGFGLQRCRLCLGTGRVDWAAKLKHFDVCPLCMNKRFIVCAECGGHYRRAMFCHRRRQAGGALEPAAGDAAYEGPIVLNLAGVGAAGGNIGVNAAGGLVYRTVSSMDDPGLPGGASRLPSSMND